MEERSKIHVGLDVHKDSSSVAAAEPGGPAAHRSPPDAGRTLDGMERDARAAQRGLQRVRRHARRPTQRVGLILQKADLTAGIVMPHDSLHLQSSAKRRPSPWVPFAAKPE